MKAQRQFIAERAAAQHCSALLRPAAEPVDLLPLFGRLGERLAAELGSVLAGLHGGTPPLVNVSAARTTAAALLAEEIAPLAANCLLAVAAAETQVLVSLEAAGVFGLVDRTYGGRGEAPVPLPESFPLSAELLLARLETGLATLLAKALDVDPVFPLVRDDSFARLAPFAPDAGLAALTLTITPIGGASWDLVLAMPLTTVAALLGHGERTAARIRGPADPRSEPFGDVPLPLKAVLVDMMMPLTAIAEIEVGSVLPVSVARNVPLRIGDRTIAHGSVGALDECAALQLTHIS